MDATASALLLLDMGHIDTVDQKSGTEMQLGPKALTSSFGNHTLLFGSDQPFFVAPCF
jgi:hypothetical protein